MNAPLVRPCDAAGILDHIDQAVALFDPAGAFLSANRVYHLLFAGCLAPAPAALDERGHLYRIAEAVLEPAARPRLQSLPDDDRADAPPYRFRRQDRGWLGFRRRTLSDGRRLHLWQEISTFAPAETQLQISRHAAMLDAVSYAAVSLIGRSDWQSVIDTLIARLGRATEVSRVVLFEIDTIHPERLTQTCRFEWSADGVSLIKDAPSNQDEDLTATDESGRAWLRRRRRGEIVQVLVRNLDGYMREKFSAEGILSMVTVPIMVDGRLWGHIDFDDCRRERVWSTPEINALQTVAALLAEIMERAQIEEQIERQREALHQADKMSALGSLLAGVAHELNNPLTVLVGQSLLLEQSLADPSQGERAAKIRAAAERCSRIVKIFLAMARRQPAAYSEARLDRIVDDVLELVAYGSRANDIAIARRLDPMLPPLWCDQDQIGQLLLNLVINAQQALAGVQRGRRLRLQAQAEDDGWVCIEIADSGPGIDPELRTRVFEPFFTTKPVGMGTGVGLSLCHGIVTSHGGTIEIDDAPEGGALFRVRLPGRAPDAAAQAETAAAEPAAPQTMRRSVLIVDDETEIAEVLAEILEGMGFRTVAAHSGNQALERLASEPFELILSDLRMPDLDGLGLYQALAERHPPMTRRLVFITGDTLHSFGAGETPTAPVLEKPFLPADVRRTVAAVLEAAEGEGRENAPRG